MVKDSSDGEPIPGVNIMVKGTQISTTTDTHGNFLLEVPVDTQTLVFSFIGMVQEEMETGPADFVEIKMKPDYRALNEVVVVGYGEAAKEKNSNNPATPEGGLDEFNRYLKENLRAPDTTKQFAVVKLECVVQPDGTLSDFVIRKSAGERYDREAIRVLKEGPRWQPASQQGKPVPKKISLRIPFKP
jgi:TonB family protein